MYRSRTHSISHPVVAIVGLFGCASGDEEAALQAPSAPVEDAFVLADLLEVADDGGSPDAPYSDSLGVATDSEPPSADVPAVVDVRATEEPDTGGELPYDCFGFVRCLDDGVIVRYEGGTQPPGDYSCSIIETYACAEGCAPQRHGAAEPEELAGYCRENVHLPEIGDPCAAEADCVWPHAPIGPDGLLNVYLTCLDGVCQQAAPPTIAGLGANCTLTSSFPAESSSACPAGVCARGVFGTGEPGTCTAPCSGDHECPPGMGCDTGFGTYCK